MTGARATPDAVTVEIIEHALWQVTDEMGATLASTSGSPAVVSAKDYATAVMRANGDLVMVSCGVLFQAVTLPYAVRHIMLEYQESPGISPGDVFLINDPYICSVHAPDMYVLKPVYSGSEHIGWVGSMTHLVDIGAMDPGTAIRATNMWQEGIRLPGVKMVEAGVLRQDLWRMLLGATRDPGSVGLDIRAQISCLHVGTERLDELVAEYGLDTYLSTVDAIIDSGRLRMQARLRELPDGIWRTRVYYDEDGQTERVYQILVSLRKEVDKLTFDFSGTSDQSPTYINCGVRGAEAGVFGALAPMLAFDIPWSQGVIDTVEVIAPKGTLINPLPPAPTSLGTLAAADAVMGATQDAIAKMLMASEEYRDDFTAMWGSPVGVVRLSGMNQREEYRVQPLLQTHGTGVGARRYADGVDTGGCMYIPEISSPNIEPYEADLPVRFLYVRERADSGGAGATRGGLGIEAAVTLHDAPADEMRCALSGRGTRAPIAIGLSGGHPAANWLYRVSRASETGGETGGQEQIVLGGNTNLTLTKGDVLEFAVHGGGGYGDPLDRDAEHVAADVRDRRISEQVAREIYGVVLQPGEAGQVDADADATKTERLRRRGHIAPEAGEPASTQPAHSRRVTEYMSLETVDGSDSILCSRCRHFFGPATENYKLQADMSLISWLGPNHRVADGFVARRFTCPGCGTQLDVEVCLKDAPVLHDFSPL